jgi:hypothetical protein
MCGGRVALEVRDGDVEVGFREGEGAKGLAPMGGRGFCGMSAAPFLGLHIYWRRGLMQLPFSLYCLYCR